MKELVLFMLAVGLFMSDLWPFAVVTLVAIFLPSINDADHDKIVDEMKDKFKDD